jgi:sugar transferase EpsL
VFRRWLERFIAAILLVVVSPLLLAAGIGVLLASGRPILFRQDRAGLNAQPFSILKFRTMSELRDQDDLLLPDEVRLTRLGALLRRTSIDELPELVNVVRGEMAFVGPRPLPTVYVDRYSADERTRLDVLPGITGWAQVHGRNEVDWDERLAMDVWYIQHRSTFLDVRILLWTLIVVVSQQGITMRNSETMRELRPPRRS